MKGIIQILVVEDNAVDALLMDAELRRGGLNFQFQRVDTREHFVQALERQRPDLILSDYGLPAFDGFAALAIAREKVPDVPFLFVTGSLGEETAINALKSGAADYILKHQLTNLASAVHRALGQAEERAKRHETETALRRSEERFRLLVQAANKELEAFSYSVSHDLRAPLRHIEGFIEMLRINAGPHLDDECLGFLKTITSSAKKMNQLIDDLLAFSRMSRTEMSHAEIDLAVLVESARRELSQGLEARNVVWSIGPLPTIKADPATLRQVFLNLISNALKYSRPRPEVKIEIGAQETPLETILYVRDNGVGFDPTYVKKLFGVFQRLHSDSEFEGTGIGLAIVQRVIARHGGRVWAEGQVGGGATFSFSIPSTPRSKGA